MSAIPEQAQNICAIAFLPGEAEIQAAENAYQTQKNSNTEQERDRVNVLYQPTLVSIDYINSFLIRYMANVPDASAQEATETPGYHDVFTKFKANLENHYTENNIPFKT